MEILERAKVHDNSKLEAPEKTLFDVLTPRLSGLGYGSEEYNKCLEELKPALDHHYANNSHHPEHFKNGVSDMNLFDIVELFMDWKASTERHNDGNIRKSIDYNKKRFKLSTQLCSIFKNTVEKLGW